MGNFQRWAYGMASVMIMAGSTAAGSAMVSMAINPTVFNWGDGLPNFLKQLIGSFAFAALGKFFCWLQKSPLPPIGGLNLPAEHVLLPDASPVLTQPRKAA